MSESVVVGIDGSAVAEAALRFAAGEAARRGARLVIAHGGDVHRQVPGHLEVTPYGELVCKEAVETVGDLYPRVECEVVWRDESPGELLVELSVAADLLVVGTHRTGRLRGWVLGSVSQYVAAHAHCPVVTLSGSPEHDDGPIVLGASASVGGLAALKFACEEAARRNVAVRAVRSVTTEDWMLSGPGAQTLIGADVLHDAARAELDKVLAIARESYPDLTITGEVSNASPFADLLNASRGASMLVIGSRRPQDASLPHLGPVAAWLLHQATSPLAVVGHAADT